MFSKNIFLIAIVLVLVTIVNSGHISSDGQGKRLLALLDNYGVRETHSKFFKSLKERGFQVTIKAADDSDLALSKYNEYLYDHLILFCPNVIEFGGNISSKAVIDFIDAGGNVLIAANSQLSEAIKEIAGECGVEYSDEDTYVIDRFNSDVSDDGTNTKIIVNSESLISSKIITGDITKDTAPVLFRGVGMTSDSENPLLLNVLTASSTAYTYDPKEKITDYPHSVGKTTVLISALQARNNARAIFTGSLDFFSNDFFDSAVQNSIAGSKTFAKSSNEALATTLTQWVFKERGVLRVASVKHHEIGKTTHPNAYTIKDDIIYKIRIEEMINGKWEGFKGTDVQFEFIRLDPFVRATLKNSNGNFEHKFKIPDVYGIFKFQVDYNRIGYTHLFSSEQMSVRPLLHTQYERFIPAAFPYYISAFTMIAGVFLFSFIQLYHHDTEVVKTKTN